MKLLLVSNNLIWTYTKKDVDIDTQNDLITFNKCIDEALRKYKMYKE